MTGRLSLLFTVMILASCGGAPPELFPDAGGGGPDGLPRKAEWPPLQTSIPTYAIEATEADLARLAAAPQDRELSIPATLVIDGARYDVELSYRGRYSRQFEKKSFQLKLAD